MFSQDVEDLKSWYFQKQTEFRGDLCNQWESGEDRTLWKRGSKATDPEAWDQDFCWKAFDPKSALIVIFLSELSSPNEGS